MLIPGRPQTKENLAVGRQYRQQVERLARRLALPYHAEGLLEIRLELYYAIPEAEYEQAVKNPATWHLHSIPRGNNAAEIILTALSGHLYRHAGQVDPLTVTRQLLTPEMLTARFGPACSDGCAVVRWS